MWWHTRRNQDFVFRRNRRVHFNQSGVSVQSTTGSRGVSISGSNPGYTMFRGSVKSFGYPLNSPVSPSLTLPVCYRVPSHFNWSLILVLEASWNVMAHAQKPRFRLSAKQTSTFKPAGGVSSVDYWQPRCISGSNAGYTMFRGSVKSIGYPLNSPVSPWLVLPVCHRVPSHFNWSLLLVPEASWNVMAHAQKPRFRLSAEQTNSFKPEGGVSSVYYWNPEVCASASVMLGTPCSEVVWRVLATHSIRQFSRHCHFPCFIVCHHISTGVYHGSRLFAGLSAQCLAWEPHASPYGICGGNGGKHFFIFFPPANTSIFNCQYYSIIAPRSFVHLSPTVSNLRIWQCL